MQSLEVNKVYRVTAYKASEPERKEEGRERETGGGRGGDGCVGLCVVEDADGFSSLHPAQANRKCCSPTTASREVVLCHSIFYTGQRKICVIVCKSRLLIKLSVLRLD